MFKELRVKPSRPAWTTVRSCLKKVDNRFLWSVRIPASYTLILLQMSVFRGLVWVRQVFLPYRAESWGYRHEAPRLAEGTVSFKKPAWWCTPLAPALGGQRPSSLWVGSQHGLQSKFKDSQNYLFNLNSLWMWHFKLSVIVWPQPGVTGLRATPCPDFFLIRKLSVLPYDRPTILVSAVNCQLWFFAYSSASLFFLSFASYCSTGAV